MSFSQGLSGLNAASKALDVVGNNIANSQTSGFKAGSIAFADVFAGTTGLGVQVAGINQNFNDGGLATTGRNLDIGISGKGFFRMVNEGGNVFYGRNGQFNLDENGSIYNGTNGLFLSGYQATGNPPKIEPGAPIGPIRIPTGDMQPAASTAGSLAGNLKADESKVISPTVPFNPSDPNSYNFPSQIEATDSLGSKHSIKIYFVQTAPGDWKAYARDETAPDMSGAGGTEKYAELDLKFDASGNIDLAAMGGNTKMNIVGDSLNGSTPLALALDLAELTKNASDSQVKLGEIDGQAPGKYQNFVIGDSGEVVATYSNGKRQTVAQIVLADFPNTSGLTAEGNNVWSESPTSGQPFYGASGSGSFGSVNGGMLEQSNVDMGQEMVNMIVYQRNYQSNSQTIKTQSELLQTLVNLR